MTAIERLIIDRERLARDVSDGVAEAIEALAQATFDRMWELLTERPSLSPREAIKRAQDEFGGAFEGELAHAFSELLHRAVGVAEEIGRAHV